MPTFNTVSEVEAYIAFKRCTDEFLANLRASIQKAERELAEAMRRFEAERHALGMPDMKSAMVPTVGVIRTSNPPPCICEGAQAAITFRKGDKINLHICEHCGGGIVSITPRRTR